MRLIDADAFVQQVAAMAVSEGYPERKACALCKLIESQPTAYDVDVVTEQIEEAKHQIFLRDDELEIYMSAMDDAIEIVQCKTVEECRSIRNKDLPKKPKMCLCNTEECKDDCTFCDRFEDRCPTCNGGLYVECGHPPNFCPNCGQKLDWSSNSEEAERNGEVNHE